MAGTVKKKIKNCCVYCILIIIVIQKYLVPTPNDNAISYKFFLASLMFLVHLICASSSNNNVLVFEKERIKLNMKCRFGVDHFNFLVHLNI